MAISNAVNLANISSKDTLNVDSVNNRVGIATTTPTEALTVVGVVSATSFFGDGSNLEGVASAGLGTALGDGTNGLEVIYFTDKVLTISDTITVDPPASTNVAYTQYSEVAVADTKDLIIADGDDFIPDILGLSTEGVTPLVGAGGRVRADNFTNKAGNGAPNFPSGLTGTTGTFSNDVSIADKIIHTGDTNTAIRFPAVDTFTIETAGSERLRITSAGEVQIANGNLKLSTAGKGIDFSATGSGSGTGTSELLDDYEEGTWTPTQADFNTWTSPTFNATYTKVGRLVTIVLFQTGGTLGWAVTQRFGGLPFAPTINSTGTFTDESPNDTGAILIYFGNSSVYFDTAVVSETKLILSASYITSS